MIFETREGGQNIAASESKKKHGLWEVFQKLTNGFPSKLNLLTVFFQNC